MTDPVLLAGLDPAGIWADLAGAGMVERERRTTSGTRWEVGDYLRRLGGDATAIACAVLRHIAFTLRRQGPPHPRQQRGHASHGRLG
jgi:hypothetical protein